MDEYKKKILEIYCIENPKGSKAAPHISRSSQDIVLDLRPMADYTVNEVAQFLMEKDYEIEFEAGTPLWVFQDPQSHWLD